MNKISIYLSRPGAFAVVRKVYQIFVLVFSVGTMSSCVADSKFQPKMSSDARNLQWEEKNGSAALPLAAAIDFCSKEATDESAKRAAVMFLDKKNMAESAERASDSDALDTVKASEMSKCMSGLGYKSNDL